MIIDCDVHPMIGDIANAFAYMPERWRRHFESRPLKISGRADDRYAHPSHPFRLDAIAAGERIGGTDPGLVARDLLDRHRIDIALLLPTQAAGVAGWVEDDAANAFVSALNDLFLERWCGYDSRYRLGITVSPHDPEAAAAEIRRLGRHPAVIAVQLPTLGLPLGNRHYHPIYQAALEQGLPIAVHQTGAEACYDWTPTVAGGLPISYAERHALLTQVGEANVASLVMEGTFDRYPGLKVLMVEYGFSWVAALLWRMDHEWKQSGRPLKRAPSQYVYEHIRLATQPIDEPDRRQDLWQLVRMAAAEGVVVFSSDYPHYDTDDPTRVVAALPADLRERICWQNAMDVLGPRLSVPAGA